MLGSLIGSRIVCQPFPRANRAPGTEEIYTSLPAGELFHDCVPSGVLANNKMKMT